MIGSTVGKYRIIAKLGDGGMGQVFLGEHPLIGRKAAIKLLHDELSQKPEMVSRFFTEARAVNEIRHPNIVEVTDLDGLLAVDTDYFVEAVLDAAGTAGTMTLASGTYASDGGTVLATIPITGVVGNETTTHAMVRNWANGGDTSAYINEILAGACP